MKIPVQEITINLQVLNIFQKISEQLFCRTEVKVCLRENADQKKRLDQKDKVNFEIHDVTAWLTSNYNTHIAQYLPN